MNYQSICYVDKHEVIQGIKHTYEISSHRRQLNTWLSTKLHLRIIYQHDRKLKSRNPDTLDCPWHRSRNTAIFLIPTWLWIMRQNIQIRFSLHVLIEAKIQDTYIHMLKRLSFEFQLFLLFKWKHDPRTKKVYTVVACITKWLERSTEIGQKGKLPFQSSSEASQSTGPTSLALLLSPSSSEELNS